MKGSKNNGFVVNNADDLNRLLTQTLILLQEDKITIDDAKEIVDAAEKLNKNNADQIEYKRLTNHDQKIDFFENEDGE